MARLSFRCDIDLVQRVDTERGLIPREAWLRRAVEQALEPETVCACGRRYDHESTAECRPIPYRQHVPGPNVENVRSSSQAKRNVKPIPKKPTR